MSKKFREGDQKRDAGLVPPPDVALIDNLSYGPHEKDNLLSAAFVRDTAGTLPVILNLHGGGYFYGDKDLYQPYCMELARHGFCVVGFNYRLAPAHQFPAQLEDVNAALSYVIQHADELHADPQNLFLIGDSAGAQLVSHYAAILTNPAFAVLFPFKLPEGYTLRAAAMNCGMYDVLHLADRSARLVMESYAGREFLRRSERLDVVGHITDAFPPSFVCTASNDLLREQAKPMAELLSARGVPVEYRLYGAPEDANAGHVFHLNIRSALAKSCNDETCAFFKSRMG